MWNENTLFTGKFLHRFPELGSTNDYAAGLLAHGKPPEGTTVWALHQTAGRGQGGTIWHDEPGQNLAFSTVLYPSFLPVQRQFALSQAIALAVADFVAQYTTKAVFVKWPNDIYVQEAKISGILIQNTLVGHTLQSSVIGIGINVNQIHFAAYPTPATSLRATTGQPHDLEGGLHDVLAHIAHRYHQLRAGQEDTLMADYLARLFRYGVPSPFARPDGSTFNGTITGIAPGGRLRIRLPDGQEETFDTKGIAFL